MSQEQARKPQPQEELEEASGDRDVREKETDLPGSAVMSGFVGEQFVERYSDIAPMSAVTPPSLSEPTGSGGITIGEALETTTLTLGNKPVEWSAAAAIQAAEVRATGHTNVVPGGVAAAAHSKIADILANATSRLPADKPATRRDAERVTIAEMRNDPHLTTQPSGVAASVAAAARLNQANNIS